MKDGHIVFKEGGTEWIPGFIFSGIAWRFEGNGALIIPNEYQKDLAE